MGAAASTMTAENVAKAEGKYTDLKKEGLEGEALGTAMVAFVGGLAEDPDAKFMAQCKKGFEAWDTNKNGTIELDELSAGLLKVGFRQIDITMCEDDIKASDMGASLDFEKFVTVARKMKDMVKAFLDKATEGFKNFDKDNSGAIDRSEMVACLTKMGMDASEAHVSEMFEKYDSDHNGTIEFKEFCEIAKDIREKMILFNRLIEKALADVYKGDAETLAPAFAACELNVAEESVAAVIAEAAAAPLDKAAFTALAWKLKKQLAMIGRGTFAAEGSSNLVKP